MTCMAVDDEPLALDLIEDNIRKISFLTLVRKCATALEANEFLQTQSVDLLFLDGSYFIQRYNERFVHADERPGWKFFFQ